MVFSSHLFVYYFLPLALLVYYALPRRAKNTALTLLSYVFYGWANPAFMVLMLTSTVVDYGCGRLITAAGSGRFDSPLPLLTVGGHRSPAQRWAVAVSVITNLSLLGFFKYFNFAVENYNTLAGSLGWDGLRIDSVMRVVLPLGISFYTFPDHPFLGDRGPTPRQASYPREACPWSCVLQPRHGEKGATGQPLRKSSGHGL
jgi:alginate O-acetyltransferase complex protein AlgI